jgi:nucleoid DNA-binding protein/nucleoid-associated protein YgaU
MTERITFKKLLEMVEKETGLNSRESDKLVRRWFSIINEGLESDGRVRISKFGTFKLQSVKERRGINPLTRESIVIPAHTKVTFHGAKHLKETVNKKYNLLEAKPITMNEEKKPKKTGAKKEVVKKEPVKKESVEKKTDAEVEDLISQIKEVPETEKTELKYEETPRPAKEEKIIEETKKKESDELRVKVEEKFSKKENDFTPTGVMSAASEKPQDKEKPLKEKKEEAPTIEKDKVHKGAPLEPEKVEVIIQKEPEKKEQVPPKVEPKAEEEKKSKLGLYIAAAVIIILLLIVVLFWKPWGQPEEVIAENPEVKEVVTPQPPKPVIKKKVYKTPGGDHAIVRGDKLWNLSEVFYKDAYLWPNIYRVNDESIPNPDILVIGEIVTIPPLEGTFRNLTANDSVNIAVGFYKAYEAYKRYGNQWAKYYLWVCKKYDLQTFKEKQKDVEQQDAQFALSMK